MMPFLHVTPVDPKHATGVVAKVYRQQASDAGLKRMRPLMALSPVPELMAATWSLLRESLIAGPVSRTEREVVALAVSRANQCQFCVAAHTMFLHATGDHRLGEAIARGERPTSPRQAALFDWATSGVGAPPPEPEFVGTALAFHFINRVVSALHTPDVLPGGLERWRSVRTVAGRAMGRAARKSFRPGDSLSLLAVRPRPPAWAGDSPVGTAFAALSQIAERGADLVADASLVRSEAAEWAGKHPPLTHGFPGEPTTRLATLAALAPYRITDADVNACGLGEADLIRLLAFGAITTVRQHEPAVR
ncbi:carboxymuconolactone decarboxylase family protein [Nonomuraea sp. NPDC050556]|uniref:carboxymuconolactone decarboxylase family protein n=1 Tax=Nonomuraea sp. NPDC050556 TaxID=3364369 RepID=UPI0037A5A6C4